MRKVFKKLLKAYVVNGFLPAQRTFNNLNWRQFASMELILLLGSSAPSYTVFLGARRLPRFLLLLFSYALFILARDIHTFMNIYIRIQVSIYISQHLCIWHVRIRICFWRCPNTHDAGENLHKHQLQLQRGIPRAEASADSAATRLGLLLNLYYMHFPFPLPPPLSAPT